MNNKICIHNNPIHTWPTYQLNSVAVICCPAIPYNWPERPLIDMAKGRAMYSVRR